MGERVFGGVEGFEMEPSMQCVGAMTWLRHHVDTRTSNTANSIDNELHPALEEPRNAQIAHDYCNESVNMAHPLMLSIFLIEVVVHLVNAIGAKAINNLVCASGVPGELY